MLAALSAICFGTALVSAKFGLRALDARKPWQHCLDFAERRFKHNPAFALSRLDFLLTRKAGGAPWQLGEVLSSALSGAVADGAARAGEEAAALAAVVTVPMRLASGGGWAAVKTAAFGGRVIAVRTKLSAEQLEALWEDLVGDRRNRRHRPGRALERCDYRFDVISDYGAFRDLQRHRLLTVEWQELTPGHGYTMPGSVVDAGVEDAYGAAMERSAELWGALSERFRPSQAAYAVALAYRIRYAMQFNAREAMHILELRTSPQGHPEYRMVCQQMHRLVAEKAGHRTIAAMMSHVDESDYDTAGLERLQGERRAEERRAGRAPTLS